MGGAFCVSLVGEVIQHSLDYAGDYSLDLSIISAHTVMFRENPPCLVWCSSEQVDHHLSSARGRLLYWEMCGQHISSFDDYRFFDDAEFP